ncbi:unnamed protein product, partial [Prorocentrum cordatum]
GKYGTRTRSSSTVRVRAPLGSRIRGDPFSSPTPRRCAAPADRRLPEAFAPVLSTRNGLFRSERWLRYAGKYGTRTRSSSTVRVRAPLGSRIRGDPFSSPTPRRCAGGLTASGMPQYKDAVFIEIWRHLKSLRTHQAHLSTLNSPASNGYGVRRAWGDLQANLREERMKKGVGMKAVIAERPDLFILSASETGHPVVGLTPAGQAANPDDGLDAVRQLAASMPALTAETPTTGPAGRSGADQMLEDEVCWMRRGRWIWVVADVDPNGAIWIGQALAEYVWELLGDAVHWGG